MGNWLQVEFGAHQVILVRSTEAIERLPDEVRKATSAQTLTISQVSHKLQSW